MISTKSRRSVIATSCMILLAILFLLPFYLMVNISTYSTSQLLTKFTFFPGNYFLENLKTIQNGHFSRSLMNSLIISVSATVISVFTSALMGFSISRYNFKLKKFFFYFVILTMMIPSQLGLVAFVVEMKALGFVNTFVPLIFVFTANSYGAFWMTQYIGSSVPVEVMESARIDGCNEFAIFGKIVIPYIRPAIFTLSILVFLWSWNNYLMPLVILSSRALFTIPLAVSTLGSLYFSDHAARVTGLVVGIMPLFIIFILGSKSFVKGLTDGAVKG